jgi:membrane protease YdiL (CAAX protease family)
VLASMVVFALVHPVDGALVNGGGSVSDGQIVLWATIATIGLVLGVAAVQTGRLAASIIAHMVINAVAASLALGLWDRLDGLSPI